MTQMHADLPSYSAGLHRFALLTAGATLILIVAGGLVTSKDAGLSVPDWPLSYGTWMPPMVGGILYEHTHRMIAATVGLLTILLNLWLWRREPRRWVRRLGLLALLAVVVQGLLGGITVLFFLPAAISVLHACLAQIFFCLIVTLAFVTAAGRSHLEFAAFRQAKNQEAATLSILTTSAVFVQLIVGAGLRHSGTVQGTKGVVLVHSVLVAHWFGALLVAVLLVLTTVTLIRVGRQRRLCYGLLGLLGVQLVLGLGAYLVRLRALERAQPVLSGVVITTSHVAIGALLLAATLVLTLRILWGEHLRPHGGGSDSPACFGKKMDVTKTSRELGPTLGFLGDYLELVKPRVTLLVLATAAAAFYLASGTDLDAFRMVHVLVGTGLLAAGTAVLNQFLERDADARMQRTMNRPLPAGRLGAGHAIWFGVALTLAGTLYLWAGANSLAALLGCLTCTVYLFVYTPLKTRTVWCTAVGAIPGAGPTLIGWAAARGALDWNAWSLFAILFLWQFPHFLAISWLYREDYQRGGFAMLPVLDAGGARTARSILVSSVALLPVTLLPWASGLLGGVYFLGALLLGGVFLSFGVEAALSRSKPAARRLLRMSVLYLPLLLVLMLLDKT